MWDGVAGGGDGPGTWRAAIGWPHDAKRRGDVDRSAGQWEAGKEAVLTCTVKSSRCGCGFGFGIGLIREI